MKKTIALILSLLAVCAFALADSANLTFDDPAHAGIQSRFSDVWIGGDYSMEIWYDDGAFLCTVLLAVNENEGLTWDYATCMPGYDDKTLICADGTKRRDVFNSETMDVIVEDVETGCSCVLTLTEKGSLVWTAQDVEAPVEFVRLDAAGDAGLLEAVVVYGVMYEGVWTSGDAVLDISQENGAYTCRITMGAGGQVTEWVYACTYDDETGLLSGKGSKASVTYGADGREVSRTEAYANGEAVFSIVTYGTIAWDDQAEGAGVGMLFSPLEDTADEAY